MLRRTSKSLSHLVATNVKAERLRLGMTQEKLAALTGFSVRFISRFETVPQNIRLDKLEKFSTSLGVSPLDLIRDDNADFHSPSLVEQFRSALGMMQSVYEKCFQPSLSEGHEVKT